MTLHEKRQYFLELYADHQTLTCSFIVQILPKKVLAKLDQPNLSGQVMFSQESPLDPTLVDIEVNNLDAYSYGIDELPTLSRPTETTESEWKRCPNVNHIIFNPTRISPLSVPTEGLGTSDQYAIGDLSGKYGTLVEKQNEKISTVDFNLPLFGHDSIVGRAVVFYTSNGTDVACANLDLVDAQLTTSFATFDVPIQGQIIMKQMTNNCLSDTYVYFELSKSDADATTTRKHPWTIHMNAIVSSESTIHKSIVATLDSDFHRQ